MTIQELEQCITLYGKDIYSFCIYLTNSKEQAEELYQDTFLEATRKIQHIQYKDNPKSYLLSMALRIWKNRIRKAAWRNRIAPQVTADEITEYMLTEEKDFLAEMEWKEEKKYLWKAIHQLPDHLKSLVLLYYMEQLSVSEISKLLSMPRGTVKSRLYKARKLLEKELEDYFYE